MAEFNCDGSSWCEEIIAGPPCGEVIGVKNWEETNMGQSLAHPLTVGVTMLDSSTPLDLG